MGPTRVFDPGGREPVSLAPEFGLKKGLDDSSSNAFLRIFDEFVHSAPEDKFEKSADDSSSNAFYPIFRESVCSAPECREPVGISREHVELSPELREPVDRSREPVDSSPEHYTGNESVVCSDCSYRDSYRECYTATLLSILRDRVPWVFSKSAVHRVVSMLSMLVLKLLVFHSSEEESYDSCAVSDSCEACCCKWLVQIVWYRVAREQQSTQLEWSMFGIQTIAEYAPMVLSLSLFFFLSFHPTLHLSLV